MKKKILAAMLAASMVMSMTGVPAAAKSKEKSEGTTFVYGTTGYSEEMGDAGLNPHDNYSGWSCLRYGVGETLFKYNDNMEVEPWLATDYEFTDDNTVKITLRDGVKFHNGQTVTAEDVVYSINRCAAVPEGQEKPLVAAFSAVRSVEALDEKTVTVTIAQRDLEFISYMTVAIIPAGYADQATAPVGTGPFRFVSRTPQENFIMERFEDYWGTPAWLDKVTYKICPGDEPQRLVHRPVRPPDLCPGGPAQQQFQGAGGHHEPGAGHLSEQPGQAL